MLSVSTHVVENGSWFPGTDMIYMPMFFWGFFASIVSDSFRLLRESIIL